MIVVWIWILAALFGLVFALISRANAKAELRDLGPVTNGRLRLGRGHIRDESIVAAIDAVWLAIGLWYVATSTATSTNVVGLILAGTSVALSISTAARWADRRYAATVHYRDPTVPETQDQMEDRQFGLERRILEAQHVEDADEAV